MGENTNIEWAHHTFNAWTGCTKVSKGCNNCYAEDWANRWGKVKWGKGQPRVKTSPANWAKPLMWNKKAEAAGERHRVFCSSLADVFDEEVSDAWRDELFELIEATPHLIWLLLTKRPDKMLDYIGGASGAGLSAPPMPTVWYGVTVEDQDAVEDRVHKLLQVPAAKRFLSVEPMLGPVDLTNIVTSRSVLEGPGISGRNLCTVRRSVLHLKPGIDWVICGGESGPKARPMDPSWAQALRDQCVEAGVPFLFKQWGAFIHSDQFDDDQFHEIDASPAGFQRDLYRFGKKKAGRTLDGRTWDQVPS